MIRLAAALALAALAGCNPSITGDGVLGEQVFNLPPFTGVDVNLGIEATVTAGASPQSVRLIGDENVLQFVAVTVSGNVLTTGLQGASSVVSQHPLQLIVAVSSLGAITAEGLAGASPQTSVTAGDVAAPSLAVAATGGGQVVVAGAGGAAEAVTLSGASSYDGSAYPVAAAAVNLTGGSQAKLEASGAVSGNVSGGSAVVVSGGGVCSAVVDSGSSCAPAP